MGDPQMMALAQLAMPSEARPNQGGAQSLLAGVMNDKHDVRDSDVRRNISE